LEIPVTGGGYCRRECEKWGRRENDSFAPSGLVPSPPSTHGLRRGLHSDAALRLGSVPELRRDFGGPVLEALPTQKIGGTS
jgi:hypothetical protein